MRALRLVVPCALILASMAVGAATTARAEPRPVILVTAFEPFGGDPINPSWQGARHLNGRVINGYEIMALEMPVDAAKVDRILSELIPRVRPAAYVAFGQGHIGTYSIERRADNEVTSGISQSSGYTLEADTKIRNDGSMVMRSTLPVDRIADVLKAGHWKHEKSDDAGGYVCEFTFYLGRYLFNKHNLNGPMGFVHVPKIWNSEPTLDNVAQACEAIVTCVAGTLAPAPEPEPIAAVDSGVAPTGSNTITLGDGLIDPWANEGGSTSTSTSTSTIHPDLIDPWAIEVTTTPPPAPAQPTPPVALPTPKPTTTPGILNRVSGNRRTRRGQR